MFLSLGHHPLSAASSKALVTLHPIPAPMRRGNRISSLDWELSLTILFGSQAT